MPLILPVQSGAPAGAPVPYPTVWDAHPDTSFPEVPTSAALLPFGYQVFQPTAQPAPLALHNVVNGPPVWDDTQQVWIETWVQQPFTPQEVQAAEAAATTDLRRERDAKLYACDWTQLPDVPLTPTQVTAWRTYRQELRDYMGTVTDPFNPPAWPVPPS